MLRKSLAPTVLVALTFGPGCGASPDADGAPDHVAITRSAIQNGQTDTADTAIVGVALITNGGIASCSGELIAPNVVLTARHCVAPTPEGYVTCGSYKYGATYPANQFYVTTHETFTYNQSDYRHPTEVRTAPGGDDLCGQDVAILILGENIPSSEATPLIPRLASPPQRNETYDAAGYGETCEDPPDASFQTAKCSQTAGTRRRVNGLTESCVGTPCGHPSEIKDSEWMGDKYVCSGDSGGPALDQQGLIIGVASRGGADAAGNCLSPIYSRVDVWKDFIVQAVLDGAKSGGYAPPDWTSGSTTDTDAGDTTDGASGTGFGGGCTTSDDCQTGLVCYVSGAGGVCTTLCDTAACGDGYACTAVGGGSVCLAPTSAGGGAADSGNASKGCAVASGGVTDPSKPVPWIVGAALLPWLRRRRRAKRA